jgi:hypothetical protein
LTFFNFGDARKTKTDLHRVVILSIVLDLMSECKIQTFLLMQSALIVTIRRQATYTKEQLNSACPASFRLLKLRVEQIVLHDDHFEYDV